MHASHRNALSISHDRDQLIHLFQLFHAKASTYFGETRDQISRLLTLTVRTGFLTALIAITIAPLGVLETLSPVGYLFILPYVFLASFTSVHVI
jgi:hypothetical protein